MKKELKADLEKERWYEGERDAGSDLKSRNDGVDRQQSRNGEDSQRLHFHIFVLVTRFLIPLLWSFCFDIVNTIYRSRDVVFMRFLVDV